MSTNISPDTGIIITVERAGSDRPSCGRKGDIDYSMGRGAPLALVGSTEVLSSSKEIEEVVGAIRDCLARLKVALGRDISSLNVLHDHSGRFPQQPEMRITAVGKS